MLVPKPYEPWSLFDQWRREMEKMMSAMEAGDSESKVATADWVPAVDIKEEDDAFVIHADVPGVDPKDIEVSMDNGVLSIKGERHAEHKEETDKYTRIERVSGTFYRRFSLPDTADADNISAKAENGVLVIRIPKKQEGQARKIPVQS